MLPTLHRLHRLPATGAGVKRDRPEEESEQSEPKEMPADHPKVVGNKLAINLQSGIGVRHGLGQDVYKKKCDRLTRVRIDSELGTADEQLLMNSLEDAELTPEAYDAWLNFLRALSEKGDADNQELALYALCRLERNVDVWLDEARANDIREFVRRHAAYSESFHDLDEDEYKERMERHQLLGRLKIYIGDARWGDALQLLYMAEAVRNVDMDMNLYEMGFRSLGEGYRTYGDISKHVNVLVQEDAKRSFEGAAQAMAPT